MKSITPIADVQNSALSRPLPAAADAPLAGPAKEDYTLLNDLSGAGILPKSGPSYYAPRLALSVQEVVNGWAARVSNEAPARHHRDFGEYMLERLPELVVELEKR